MLCFLSEAWEASSRETAPVHHPIGGAAAAWPLAAGAQQAAKLPTIGFLGATTPSADGQRFAAFVQRLRELSWIEGRNVAIEVRWAGGRSERFMEIAAEFVRLKVDVILTHNTSPTLAAKQAHLTHLSTPPFTSPRSTRNITSLQSRTDAVQAPQLLPTSSLPILANVTSAFAVLETNEVQAVARKLDLEPTTFEIRGAEDIAPAFDALKGRADALYVVLDPVMGSNRIRINTLALGARLPTMHTVRELVEAGGLLSYGPNWPNQFRRDLSKVI